MKKTVTVGELKSYCSQNKPKEISFLSENQPWYRVSDPCKVRCTFPIMLIYENPNLVCLKSGRNTICFDRVKFAELDTDSTVLGTTINLHCGNAETDVSYILIVR